MRQKNRPGMRAMTQQLVSFGSALGLLALLSAGDAGAVDLPVRKAGLWEMKVLRT